MKLIKLGGKKGLFVKVDDDDFELLSQYNWCPLVLKTNTYAHRREPIANRRNKEQPNVIMMHRVIMGISNWEKKEVDHKDNDGLNNQRHNLVACNRMQNTHNCSKRIGNYSSIYKGVNIIRYKTPKWEAAIMVNGRRIRNRHSKTEVEAALLYNKLAVKYHGEFANLNIIKP